MNKFWLILICAVLINLIIPKEGHVSTEHNEELSMEEIVKTKFKDIRYAVATVIDQ